MNPTDWLGMIFTLISILALIAGGVKWLVKSYLHELRPNSGSSLKDQVNRLENRLNDADEKRKDMSRKLDHMYDILIEYISKNKI